MVWSLSRFGQKLLSKFPMLAGHSTAAVKAGKKKIAIGTSIKAFHQTLRVETELLSTHSVPFYQSSFAKCPLHNRPGFRRERFMRPIKRNANVGGDFEKWQKYRHYRPARLQ